MSEWQLSYDAHAVQRYLQASPPNTITPKRPSTRHAHHHCLYYRSNASRLHIGLVLLPQTCRSGPPSGSSQVEWYQAGAAASDFPAAGPADYSYDAMGVASSSSAAYGSFEEEAPLLEGQAQMTDARTMLHASSSRAPWQMAHVLHRQPPGLLKY